MERRNSQRSFSIAFKSFNDMHGGSSDTVNGASFSRNDLTAGFFNIGFNVLTFVFGGEIHGSSDSACIFIERNACNGSGGPCNERTVAVFAENVCMNLTFIYVIDLCKTGTKSDRIENGTGRTTRSCILNPACVSTITVSFGCSAFGNDAIDS